MSERELLHRTAEIAGEFLETLPERPVWPPASIDELRRTLGGPLPNESAEPLAVIEELAAAADRGVVAMPGDAISVSSSAARSRPRWLRTGSRARGTRTRDSSWAGPRRLSPRRWPASG